MKPLYHFCTMFDRNYLSRGLALYRSLEHTVGANGFALHVLCLDDDSRALLERLALPSVRIITLAEFEDPELLRAKPTRSRIEYYWTCTPSLPLYVMRANPDAEVVTYADADLFFFSTPRALLDEMADAAVMIHEHRFPPRLAGYVENGIYNVGWVSFRRDDVGIACATRWRQQCIEWCYYRHEGDRMGDQKYLDTWPRDFPRVHIMQNTGGGLAPWNIEQYHIHKDENARVFVDDQLLVFAHFHGLRIFDDGSVQQAPSTYPLRAEDLTLVYAPYERALRDAYAELQRVSPGFKYGLEKRDDKSTLDKLAEIERGASQTNGDAPNRASLVKRAARWILGR